MGGIEHSDQDRVRDWIGAKVPHISATVDCLIEVHVKLAPPGLEFRASLPEHSADSREAENHPLPPRTFSTIVRATHKRLILIGAHDLATGSGRESLIDSLGRRHGEEACR